MDNIQLLISNFIQTYGTDIAWIFGLFFLGRFLLKKIIKRIVKLVEDEDEAHRSAMEKRAQTLGNVVVNVGNVIIIAIVLLMTLELFGVDIRPILAGIGIMGLAVGFGAQSLVKDFVSGLFVLIENQYSVGDHVKIGALEGKVKKITMRSTVLRDDEGKTFYISNGSVSNVINFSQGHKQS